MYNEHSGDDYRALYGFPADYAVESVLAYGCWDLEAEASQLPLLRAALEDLGLGYILRRLQPRGLAHAYELEMGGRRHWFVPVMGTAVMSQYLHIAALLGAKRFVLLGIVGGLSPELVSADLLLPSSILGNENARFYDRNNMANIHLPDPHLAAMLRQGLVDVVPASGPTVTCEMMLAETRQDVMNWSASGFVGVEMEGALVFAMAKHFGIPAAALFYVADNLVADETMVKSAYARHARNHARVRALQYVAGLRALLAS